LYNFDKETTDFLKTNV
jgi:hypothetical protein